ncbi:TRAP transporter small permease [Amorphus sp. 3PC139-8]|uniref:TRAP transporter small permease n=1 Tax=Amorphus sp. 3PC139-8 TaxID=2735676 RepID=UPI00345D5A6E
MLRASDWIIRLGEGVAMAALAAMMLHLGADIVLRTAFGHPLGGTVEIVAEIYMPLVVFGALAAVQLRGEEIRVDLIDKALTPAMRRRFDQLSQLVMAAAAVALAWYTGGQAVHAIKIGKRIELEGLVLPSWPGHIMVAVGFALLAVAALARAFRVARP